ncbi:hypothetical protein E4U43_001672 [Claviceps pusilla]|uniref:Major facilitator superfamily (MFS) profile domain-containing protein n=1 Tax=Claviceps pusilla TaxID=123648 RepID=A0A9P7N8K3_9HYPO|nr:hypothetical protein E4U43_001672 [Claviceps pusilla]
MENQSLPFGFHWRSKPSFVISTVALGLFTDLFLYGIIVPVLPFLLRERLDIPNDQIQVHISALLAAYAGTSVVFSFPVGWIADKIGSRRLPFLAGLVLLLVATLMLAFSHKLAFLVIARSLQGVSASIVWTAGLAMVQDAVGPKGTGQALGTISSVISVGELLAPVVGGLLYHRAGISAITAVSMGLLGIDLVMRLLVIDAKMIPKNNDAQVNDCSSENGNLSAADSPREPQPQEGDPLLRKPKPSNEEYKIRKNPTPMEFAVPILYCFRNRRFVTAMILVTIQSLLIGAFDATVPEETKSLFHFSSLQVGLVFIAIVVPNLVLGPVAGMAVDKYGTKVVATAGYLFLVPCLLLLGLPSQRILAGTENIILFCAVLALNGAGMSIIASPGLVEATHITEKYEAANPDFFGQNGPYAQLYGFSSLCAFAGLACNDDVAGRHFLGNSHGLV